jgi:hypothetical protein
MVALPMTLETALRHAGFTIDAEEAVAFDITIPEGTLHVPAMVRSKLTWQREGSALLGDDLYLSSLPLFAETYRPVLLSSILDRYRTRRLGYNTPGEFRLAFRRWGNLNMTVFNRRYASTAVALPLDDHDEVVAATEHSLDIDSDFPQELISGSTDYASTAADRRTADNSNATGRRTSIMQLLEQQRATYLNVDLDVIDGLDSLFLGIFDRGEQGEPDYAPPRGSGYGFGGFNRWGW